ncbi:MAG: hypothetical protein RIT27_1773 [Pseudomonadota bacterium]|jgi:hypothetical protein
MRKLNVLATSIILALGSQVVVAADYLLDASTMSVGSTAGENLVVKEGCLDPTKTSCTEKVKWLAAPLTKVGSLDVVGSLSGNFQIDVSADFNNVSKGIIIFTADNKSLEFSIAWGEYGGYEGYNDASFYPKGFIAEGKPTAAGGGYVYDTKWSPNNNFNTITLIIQQGVAQALINGSQIGESITFPPETVFSRVVLKGIDSSDRLSEVKVKGISNTASCSGSSTTTTPVSGTTNTGDLPQIASNLDIKIPRGLYAQSAGIFTPAGSIPIWANLKYVPQNGQHLWTLTGAGVLPQ